MSSEASQCNPLTPNLLAHRRSGGTRYRERQSDSG
jgi:hypothetical protein